MNFPKCTNKQSPQLMSLIIPLFFYKDVEIDDISPKCWHHSLPCAKMVNSNGPQSDDHWCRDPMLLEHSDVWLLGGYLKRTFVDVPIELLDSEDLTKILSVLSSSRKA